MKKALLVFLLLVLASSSFNLVNAQCTPDVNIGGAYLYPATLPFAEVNVPYSKQLTFRIPLDSTIDQGGVQVQAHVDSAQLAYILGMPSGFSPQCNSPRCTWAGGSLGCALITGMADASKVGEYPMWVYVVTWMKLGTVDPISYSRIDSSQYTFKIIQPAGVFEVEPYQQLTVYPNPVKDKLNIELRDLKTAQNIIEVFDATGKKVYEKAVNRPLSYLHTEQVDLSGFAAGLYTVMLKTENNIMLRKVLRD